MAASAASGSGSPAPPTSCRSASGSHRRSRRELPAQTVHVAQHPHLAQAAAHRREEGGAAIGDERAGRGDAEDLSMLMTRIAQPRGGAVSLSDQLDDLVVEVREG